MNLIGLFTFTGERVKGKHIAQRKRKDLLEPKRKGQKTFI